MRWKKLVFSSRLLVADRCPWKETTWGECC